MVWLQENDGEISISQTNGLSDSTPVEYRQGFIDFVRFHFIYQKNKQDIYFGNVIEETGDNYTLQYNYNRLLPFFQFLDISIKGELEPFYILNTAGIINDKNLNEFFNIAPVYLEEKPRSVKALKIPIKKSKTVSIDGFSTELDENWTYNESLGGPGYWLNFNTFRDSQITVETIPEKLFEQKDFDIEKICKAAILSSQKVDYKSVAGFYERDVLYVSFSLLDPNDIKNYQFLFINKNKLINFSTFSDVFDANKEYYKKIINKMIQ